MYKLFSYISVTFLSLVGLSSCIIDLGLTSNIKRVPEKYLPLIVNAQDKDIATLPRDSMTYGYYDAEGNAHYVANVYVVTEEQIKDYACSCDSALVNYYAPTCSSDHCVSPAMFEQYCDDHHYTPILVMAHFDVPHNFAKFDAKHTPCLFLDTSKYNDRTNKFVPGFQKYMTGNPKDYGFWIFKNGRYDRSIEYLK